jgi:hypothetical protein
MFHPTTARLGVGVLFGVTSLVIGTAAFAPAPSVMLPDACTATVANAVPVQAGPVVVNASLSEAIGDSVTASFPAESKVSVVKVDGAGGNAVELTLNTSGAVAGDWQLSLTGSKGTCTGQVKVGR